VEFDSPEFVGIVFSRSSSGEQNGLVANQSGLSVDRMGVEPPELDIGFGASDKKSRYLGKNIETLEVHISTVHDHGAGFQGNEIQGVDIVEFAVGNMNEGRNISLQIEKSVRLDGSFVLAESRPGENFRNSIHATSICWPENAPCFSTAVVIQFFIGNAVRFQR
jgi:hypothetical protein